MLSLAGGRILAALLSWIWLVVAARHLTVEEFGNLALLLAIGAVVSVVGDLGLPLVLMKHVTEDQRTAWTALTVTVRKRLVAGAVASALATAAFAATSAPGGSLLLPAVYAVSIVSTTVHTSVSAALRAVGSARAEAVNEAVSRLGVLVLGSFLLVRGGGLLAAVATYAVADLASAAVLGLTAHRRLAGGTAPVDREQFAIGRTGPLAVGSILGALYNRLDVWLLAVLGGAQSVAVYAASYRLLDGLLLPAGAASALVVPRTASAGVRQRNEVIHRSLRTLMLVVLPAALVLAVFAAPVLAKTFGPAYRGGEGILAILLLSAAPAVAVLLLAPVAALAHPRAFLRIVVASLALNGMANLSLIPTLGAAGAAWATVISQALLATLLWRTVHSETGMRLVQSEPELERAPSPA